MEVQLLSSQLGALFLFCGKDDYMKRKTIEQKREEIGYLPTDEEEAKLFFQLIDKRCENKSTIFTTNSNFKPWGDIFQDPKIANAILDRILHHASVVNIIGDSYRLKNHLQKDDKSNVQ